MVQGDKCVPRQNAHQKPATGDVKKDIPQKQVDSSTTAGKTPDALNKDQKQTNGSEKPSSYPSKPATTDVKKDDKPVQGSDKPAYKFNCDLYGGRNIQSCELKGNGACMVQGDKCVPRQNAHQKPATTDKKGAASNEKQQPKGLKAADKMCIDRSYSVG
jgi:hypothetical protein